MLPVVLVALAVRVKFARQFHGRAVERTGEAHRTLAMAVTLVAAEVVEVPSASVAPQ